MADLLTMFHPRTTLVANLFKLNQPAPIVSKRRDRRFYHSKFAVITLTNVNKETIIPVSMQAVNHGFFISAYLIKSSRCGVKQSST